MGGSSPEPTPETRPSPGGGDPVISDYIQLIRDYPRFLVFSSLHMFFSGPGQSFSFALFAPSFAAAFALGAGGFGTLYSAATLASAGLLPFFGPIIDRINLRTYSVLVGLVMALSLVMTSAARSLPVLFIGVLLLRFSGQGLMTQIGGISTTRFFGGQRGKALAIIGLGFSFSLALFPVTVAYLIARFGWQNAMLLVAALVVFVFLPSSLGLLKKTDLFQHPPAHAEATTQGEAVSWTRKDVLKAPFFYFAVPIALVIPFFSTGLIIHLGKIAEHKDWSLEWVASCFIASAITGRVGSFGMGPLVDRFTARRVFPFVLVPYVIALTVLASQTHPYAAVVWMGMGGLSFGCVTVTMPALWAETFGIRSLGAIVSVVGSAGVFATALSPALFGWLLDGGLDVDRLILGGVALAVLVSLIGLAAPAPTRHPSASPAAPGGGAV
jgi:MFS family permease